MRCVIHRQMAFRIIMRKDDTGNPPRPKQIVSFEEMLMSQVISQDALIRLLIEKGVFTKEDFLGKVRDVDHERKRKGK